MAQPIAPGALNVTPTGAELVLLAGVGPTDQQCSVNKIASGGSANRGTCVANGSTPVVVNNVNVGANTIVLFTLNTLGGTQGAAPTVTVLTAGASFTFVATAGDTSTYNYQLLNG